MADAKLSWTGRYRDFELIGEGAMGVVYRAVDSALDRTVAIKVMNESIARQEDLRQRFLREAKAAGALQHPNVVCIHDLGEMEGQLFIAMEFVDGVDLERLIELEEPLSLQGKLDIIIDVLSGLGFAHKHGIVHRDIKPANIRVGEDGRAKIMDFGIAHLTSSKMTNTGSILGTPSYMAPEQITEGKTSPASDIFAVGAVLYQLLSSMKPFDGANTQNLLFRIVTEKPRPIRELVPSLPAALDHIVMKAMAKDPSERYANASDMANDLASVRSKLSGPSYPASASLSASVVSAIDQSRKRSRRMRNLAFAGGGVLASALLIAIAWPQLWQFGRPTRVAAGTPNSRAKPTSSQIISARIPATAAKSVVGAEQLPSASRRATSPEKSVASGRDAPVVGIMNVATERTRPLATSGNAALTGAPVPSGTMQQEAASTSPLVVTTQPIVPPPTHETTSPPVAPATAADIAPAVEAYARAIESRNIGAIRSIYPGLTSDQQRGFEQLFQAAPSINVTLRVANVASSGALANAQFIGRYDYVTAEGRQERQPVSVAATLRHDGKVWRLVSVR